MLDKPEQEALFYIEGPDERGCVSVHGTSSADPWTRNLGPAAKVAEVLSQWLGTIDYDEVKAAASKQPRPRTIEQPEVRAQRLEERARKRVDDANIEEDAIDAMIRRNIEEHGA